MILGHTHVYYYRQWKEDKEYFNTGTWTDVTSLEFTHLGRITKLTYVAIEYPDEDKENSRPRCFLREWKGYHKIEADVAPFLKNFILCFI